MLLQARAARAVLKRGAQSHLALRVQVPLSLGITRYTCWLSTPQFGAWLDPGGVFVHVDCDFRPRALCFWGSATS